jgi:hypothetical protein
VHAGTPSLGNGFFSEARLEYAGTIAIAAAASHTMRLRVRRGRRKRGNVQKQYLAALADVREEGLLSPSVRGRR